MYISCCTAASKSHSVPRSKLTAWLAWHTPARYTLEVYSEAIRALHEMRSCLDELQAQDEILPSVLYIDLSAHSSFFTAAISFWRLFESGMSTSRLPA